MAIDPIGLLESDDMPVQPAAISYAFNAPTCPANVKVDSAFMVIVPL